MLSSCQNNHFTNNIWSQHLAAQVIGRRGSEADSHVSEQEIRSFRNAFEQLLASLANHDNEEANSLMVSALETVEMMNNALQLKEEVSLHVPQLSFPLFHPLWLGSYAIIFLETNSLESLWTLLIWVGLCCCWKFYNE